MTDTPQQRYALIMVVLSSIVTPMMLSAVNVAIPSIAAEFGVDAVKVSWVATGYLLTSSALLLPFGRLADMVGRKRIYATGLITVAVGSLVALSAGGLTQLLTARVIQGCGAAMLFATGNAILTAIFPEERRGAVLGVSVGTVYVGLTLGPLLGGWFIETLSWRMIFLFYLPFSLASLAVALLLLKGDWKAPDARRFDWPGALLYAGSLPLLMVGLSKLSGFSGWLLAVVGLAGVLMFGRMQLRREQPLFDVRLFLGKRVVTCSCLAALIMYASTFANTYLLSVYLQVVRDLPPTAAGVIMLAQPLVMAILSPLTGRLSDRIEPRLLASTGMLVTFVGQALLATAGMNTSNQFIFGSLLLVGLGFAMFSSPNISAIMGSVPKPQLGSAAGTVGTMRVVGQTLSMGIVTVVVALLVGPVQLAAADTEALVASTRVSFVVMAALCLLGAWISLQRGNLHDSETMGARKAPSS